MRKGWKIFWIVCGVATVIGIVCCAAALTLGVTREMVRERFQGRIGWKDDGDDIVSWTENVHETDTVNPAKDVHEVYQGVSKIDLEMFAGRVEFRVGDGSDIRVDTDRLSDKLGFRCYMDEDELKITGKKKIYGVANPGTITVYLPSDMVFEEVSLEMGAGSLYIEDVATGDLSVNIGAGEVIINHFRADEADFECGAGTIEAHGSVRSKADIQCGVGSIAYTASGREEDYDYEIDSGIGEVVCGSNSYAGLGKSRKINNGAGRKIKIEGGVGEVVVDFDGSDTVQ